MFYRAAALSFLLTASFAFTYPLNAQNHSGVGDLVNTANVPVGYGDGGAIVNFGSISGSVSTSDHRAATDARVEVHDLSTGATRATGYINPSGTFSFRNLPRGYYEVIATSGISEAREQVQVDTADTAVNLTLPHTDTTDPSGQKIISVAQLQVPEKAQKELDKAKQALQKKNSAEARKNIEKALSVDPTFADAFVLRGAIEVEAGNLPAATQDFNQAVQYDPSSAMAYVGTGAVFNMQGRFDDAMRELDRGVALNPTLWQAQFELAKANLGKGNFEAALRSATKAQELAATDFPPIHVVKGHALLGLKDYSTAVSEFEAFLSKDGQSADADAVRHQVDQARAFITTAAK